MDSNLVAVVEVVEEEVVVEAAGVGVGVVLVLLELRRKKLLK